jgi:hypothetical protein
MTPLGWRGYFVSMVIVSLMLVLMTLGCTDLQGTSNQTGGTAADQTTAGSVTTVTMETTTTVAVATTDMLPATTTSAQPPQSTTSTSALSSAEERLPNGNIKAMGYIDKVWVDGGVRHIRIDYAEFLTGAEADAAAIAAGVIPPGEQVDNGYFITNVNPLKRTFDVSDSVAITTATRSGGFDEPATWAEFKSWFGPSPPAETGHLHAMPWWIERDAATDLVIRIDEQYLP